MKMTLSRKIAVMTAIAIGVTITLVVAPSYFMAKNLLVENASKEILPGKIESVASELYREMQPFLTVAVGMNADLIKMKPVITGNSAPEDDKAITDYLTHIKNAHNTSAAFFASSVSERYYVYDKFLKVLSKSNEKDRWFYDAMSSDKPYLYNMDLDENNNNIVSVFLNYRVTDSSGRYLGIAGVGNALTYFSQKIEKFNSSNTSKVYLINNLGQVVLGGTQDQIRKPYTDDGRLLKTILDSRKFVINNAVRDGSAYLVASYFVPEIGWHILMEFPESVILEQANSLALHEIIICAVCIPFFSFLIALIISRMMLPLRNISKQLRELGGDLTFRIEYGRNDEIGDIAHGVNAFIKNLHGLISNNKRISKEIYEIAEFTGVSSDSAEQELERQKETTEKFVSSISSMSDIAHGVASSAEDAAGATGRANEVTDEGISHVKSMIDAMNEVSFRVDEAVKMVNTLNESSQEIKGILGVISSISEKTTLLSLNAAIEAARAGEAGRGFAVVADEIRALATKTKSSTGEIARVINELQSSMSELNSFMTESQRESHNTMDVARHTETLLRNMADITSDINSKIVHISESVESQSEAMEQLKEHSVVISTSANRVYDILTEEKKLLSKQKEYAESQEHELGRFNV